MVWYFVILTFLKKILCLKTIYRICLFYHQNFSLETINIEDNEVADSDFSRMSKIIKRKVSKLLKTNCFKMSNAQCSFMPMKIDYHLRAIYTLFLLKLKPYKENIKTKDWFVWT